MKLFLCSHFSSVGNLIKEDVENKKVVFIPTASIHEGYTGYVNSARKLFKKIGAILTEIDISKEEYSTIKSVFEESDVIYFTGGNSFFLIDQLRKSEFVERFPELSLFFKAYSLLDSEMICIFPYLCPYAESAREIREIFS